MICGRAGLEGATESLLEGDLTVRLAPAFEPQLLPLYMGVVPPALRFVGGME